MHKVVKSNLVMFQETCLVSGVSRKGVLHCCTDERTMQATSTTVDYINIVAPLKPFLNKECKIKKK